MTHMPMVISSTMMQGVGSRLFIFSDMATVSQFGIMDVWTCPLGAHKGVGMILKPTPRQGRIATRSADTPISQPPSL